MAAFLPGNSTREARSAARMTLTGKDPETLASIEKKIQRRERRERRALAQKILEQERVQLAKDVASQEVDSRGAGESKAGASAGASSSVVVDGADSSVSARIADPFNTIDIFEFARDIADEIKTSKNPQDKKHVKAAAGGEGTYNTREAQAYRNVLDDTIGIIFTKKIKDTINKVIEKVKAFNPGLKGKKAEIKRKIIKKLEINIKTFTKNLQARSKGAFRDFKMSYIDIAGISSNKKESYTLLFDTLFGDGYIKSFETRPDILNNIADATQCKIILQKRIRGELPFLYDYPSLGIAAGESKVMDASIRQNAVLGWEKMFGTCYLCNTPYSFGELDKTPECEHILSIFLALRLVSIVREEEYTDDQWEILNYEYEFSDKCCNRIKKQIAFIKSNMNRFQINDSEINNFYMKIKQNANKQNKDGTFGSMGCKRVWDNIMQKGERQGLIDAKTFLTKRLSYIVDYLNTVYEISAAQWFSVLQKYKTFKGVKPNGPSIFQLHLCHSIMKALTVLDVEQLFIVIDRSGTSVKKEFKNREQELFDNITEMFGDSAALYLSNITDDDGDAGASAGSKGGGKTKKNQKGGNKIVSDAIKALREEFIKIIESDEPIIEEKDIFKHLLLTYGAPGIEPHTHYYVNDGNVRIQGSLTNGEQLLYDNDILNEKIDSFYMESREKLQKKIKMKEIYYTLKNRGQTPHEITSLITRINEQGNLDKAVQTIRDYKNTIAAQSRLSLRPQMPFSLRPQMPFSRPAGASISVRGGKKKRKKRRTRKLKRKKKRKSRRKRTRRKKKK